MAFKMKYILILLMIFPLFCGADSFFVEFTGKPQQKLIPNSQNEIEVTLPESGSALVYHSKDRKTIRFQRDEFIHSKLIFEYRLESNSSEPLRGCLFVKDKDGWWFQDSREFQLKPSSEWQTLELDVTAAETTLMPSEHQAAWGSYFAASRQSAGFSFYGINGQYKLYCRPIATGGKRSPTPLAVINWKLQGKTDCANVLQSTFELSREYCNPFDPDEIMVDYEVCHPDGRIERFPAFFTIDYARRRHFTKELNTPVGRPYWAFRFTPEKPGAYQFRIVMKDASTATAESAATPWRQTIVSESPNDGFVRRDPEDSRWLEFSNGKHFFPVGINIHTNVDLRSESDFKFGHLPDQGTYDYDEYFEAMAQAGINAVEIWMAAWSFAIEWNSSRANYHGLGRYNLCNAARLDHVLQNARKKGIYVHLTLDNHTKNTTLEWFDNPFNSSNPFKVANGSFLENSEEMFNDQRARKFNRQRNRYIAARWGAEPAIVGVEFWSEIDLVPKFTEMYDNNIILDWHREVAREFRAMNQGKHLLTTHYCGDYKRLLRWHRLMELDELDYVVGDAYRDANKLHFVDLMISHAGETAYFDRPVIITEYGGRSSGDDQHAYRLADLHSAAWLALFLRQSAVPFTWWHDFVHINNYYPHYRGFVDFIHGIELRDNYQYRTLQVGLRRDWSNRPISAPGRTARNLFLNGTSNNCHLDPVYNSTGFPVGLNYVIQGLSMVRQDFWAGWIFCREFMNAYPMPNQALNFFENYVIQLDPALQPGVYRLTFYDTITNNTISETEIIVEKSTALKLLPVPAFKIDIAFKMERVKP